MAERSVGLIPRLLRDPVTWLLLGMIGAASAFAAHLFTVPDAQVALYRGRMLALLDGSGAGATIDPPPGRGPSTNVSAVSAVKGGAGSARTPVAPPEPSDRAGAGEASPRGGAESDRADANRPDVIGRDGEWRDARADGGRDRSPPRDAAIPSPETEDRDGYVRSERRGSADEGPADARDRDRDPDRDSGLGRARDEADADRDDDPRWDDDDPRSRDSRGEPAERGEGDADDGDDPRGVIAQPGRIDRVEPDDPPPPSGPRTAEEARIRATDLMVAGQSCAAVRVLEPFAADGKTRSLLVYARERCGRPSR